MKHLKYFEKKEEYYNKEYVLLDTEKIIKNLNKDEHPPEYNLAQINFIDYIMDDNDKMIMTYDVLFPSYDRGEVYSVKEDEIIRKLTPEEIETFKRKKKFYDDSKKYNL